MSHIRLIGLFLFITAITLALAAAATRTTHVQVSRDWLVRPAQPVGVESSTTMPPVGSTPSPAPDVQPYPADRPLPEHAHVHDWDYAAHQSQFHSTAIPIAWPLLITGGVGLLLWFVQAPSELRPAAKKRTGRRKRRR